MMWSDLKAVVDWFRGEDEPPDPDADPGVASIMRIVAAHTMSSIHSAREKEDRLPYRTDEQEAMPASTTAPAVTPPKDDESAESTAVDAAPLGDDQEPPCGV